MTKLWFSWEDFSPCKRTKWGPWRHNRKDRTLCHENGYGIDLDECGTSAQVLDWIFQVFGKQWADPFTVASLLEALEDLVDPQKNLCSGGIDQNFNAREWLEGGVV
jgi:hypothetical protein